MFLLAVPHSAKEEKVACGKARLPRAAPRRLDLGDQPSNAR